MGKAALLINSMSGGGAERVVTTILRRLHAQGHPVELICLERGRFYDLPERIPVSYLGGGEGDETGGLKLAALPLYALRLKQLVRKRGIGVVQSHLYRASYVNALAALLGSPHRVQVVNCRRTSLYAQGGLSGKVNLLLINRLYRRAEVIVTKSEGMRDDLKGLFPFLEPISVIHNPYDIDRIRTLAEEPADEPWLAPGRRVVLSVGRLIAVKRPMDLLLAFRALCGRHQELELAFLGDGEERDSLCQTAVKLGIGERVHLAGNVRNPFKYMRRASCMVLSSFSEGFPNVLVEAMISRCPVVASDCLSGPREILAPKTDPRIRLEKGFAIEEAGILYAVGDVPALAESLSRLLIDSELAGSLVEAGQRRACDFRQEIIVEQYRKLLWG